MGKIGANAHLFLNPSVVTPIGGGTTLANFLLSAWFAARQPLHGSFFESKYSGLETGATIAHLLERAQKRIGKLERRNAELSGATEW